MRDGHSVEMEETLGEAMRRVRAANGNQSQQSLADQLGTSQPNIQRWEDGTGPTEREFIEALMSYLNVSFNDLSALIVRGSLEKKERRRRG
jgi:transcriptional regulator with XRE-family HTH domain